MVGVLQRVCKIDNGKKAGANIINIHHAEDIYPFINYPYLDEMFLNYANLLQMLIKKI